MKVVFSAKRDKILFLPDMSTPVEHKAMSKISCNMKHTNNSWYCPAKVNIAHNIISRIKSIFKQRANICPKVTSFIDGEFKLLNIPKDFKFLTSPLKHQMIALRYVYTVEGGGLLLDPGLGKTKIVLDYIALAKFNKSLIICPKALLSVWVEEVAKHRWDKSIYIIKSTSWGVQIKNQKKKIFDRVKATADIKAQGKYNVTERLIILEKRFYRSLNNKIQKLQVGWEEDSKNIEAADIVVVNYDKVAIGSYLLEKIGFDFVAVDEGLIKDPVSERTKAITRLGYSIPYRCIMSGTLVNNTPLDMFAPTRFMQPSLTGVSFAKFRDRYGIVVKPKNKKNISILVGYRDVQEVRSILDSCSIVMSKDEWLDLPEKKFHIHYCPMSDNQQQHYENLAQNYITKVNDKYVEVDSPLTVMCKLSQVSNGFLYINNEVEDTRCMDIIDDTPYKPSFTRETVIFDQQPKIAKLDSLYNNEIKGCKFILWYNMSAELTIIMEYLDRVGASYLIIKGGEKDTGGKVNLFNRDSTIQILVCQARSVNYGITVLGNTSDNMGDGIPMDINSLVYTQVFYSLSYSLELYLQQQDRCHRIGQTHIVDYYIILMDNECERAIISRLQNKMSIRGEVLVDIINSIRHEIGN